MHDRDLEEGVVDPSVVEDDTASSHANAMNEVKEEEKVASRIHPQSLEGRVFRNASRTSHIEPGCPPDGGLQAWIQVLMGHITIFNTWG